MGRDGRQRVLLLASTRAYNAGDFAAAGERLGVEVVMGTDRCHVLAEVWPEGALALPFDDVDAAAAEIAAHAADAPLDGIVATDEVTAVIAARAAQRLNMRFNPPEAARIAGDKLRAREVLTAAGLRQPAFASMPAGAVEARLPAGLEFPVVLKPLHLSGSRGVMRADGPDDFARRHARLARLLADPEVREKVPEASATVLVESFVAGPEVAFEGLLVAGELQRLAIFDKPDPLDGPFFAETIYVTPSTLDVRVQDAVAAEVAAVARAFGLVEGPVHAEIRIAADGPVVLELAARSIGGLCNRTLQFATGLRLEDVIMAHASGRGVDDLALRDRASGVAMLPVPESGVLRAVEGLAWARNVDGIDDVVITVELGETLVPLPEGQSYVGFVFATGDDTDEVTRALRDATALIRLDIAPML